MLVGVIELDPVLVGVMARPEPGQDDPEVATPHQPGAAGQYLPIQAGVRFIPFTPRRTA